MQARSIAVKLEVRVHERNNCLGRLARGQELAVHGWVYGLEDGLVKDLGVRVDDSSQVPPPFRFIKAGHGLLEGAK